MRRLRALHEPGPRIERTPVEVRYIIGAARRSQFPSEELPEVAFLGRSNVGKSSLLNCLLGGRRFAKTSSTPGATRLIHFYRVDGRFQFADLPGYGYARVPQEMQASWRELAEAYLLERRGLAAAILLLDSRRGWMQKDKELKDWLEFHERPYLVVATKIDKLNQSERMRGLAAIRGELGNGSEPIPFSAVTGQGAKEIWQAIWRTQNRP